MPRKNRDDFLPKTVLQIAKRAGWLCSFPTCRTPTVGATSDGEGEINIGTAAHICAAAPGGPRYDENMSPEERSSAKNGIWMCRDHGKAIDSTDPEFTVERLSEWKRQAEMDSWRRVLRNDAAPGPAVITDVQLVARIRSAAEADLMVFRRTAKWPGTSVALTLKVEGFSEPVTTSALAGAVTSLDDLILIAPPGMGKTSTLFQIAKGMLANGNGTPFVVPLGDWATDRTTILDSILERPTFGDISKDDFRKAATYPGIVLLLDGWNELDADARKLARVQVNALKAELPQLGLVISTRKQALDVPFGGTQVDLLPLNEGQQMQIAVELRGDVGAKIVDQAWRTGGVRELVSIPLYLTALLSLPESAPFPTTKEEVLSHFVSAHENKASCAEALRSVVKGFQQDYLDSFAVFATCAANTAIADINVRRLISETATQLAENGQITNKPEPDEVIDVLVCNHVLMRAGDVPGYSFQHQQFQEWYASHSVERRIVAEASDPKEREALKAEVFNLPAWEEAILFAVERLARGDAYQRTACGKAIIAAFEADPILAADMIFRSTEEVWKQIASTIQGLVVRWHAPGKVDRSLRFMLTTGRPEFLDAIWPLITDQNDQISLKVLRNCRQFRPSILGKDASKKIRALPQRTRTVLLCEMASHSGVDGLDLASAIAKDDPDPELQASVVEELAFRRADRHVALVLQNASEMTFDLIARKGLVNEVDDEQAQKALSAARKRLATAELSDFDRLRVTVKAQDGEGQGEELVRIISTMDIDRRRPAFDTLELLEEAYKHYPREVSEAMQARLLSGREMFYSSDHFLASMGLSLEDESLLQIAMAEIPDYDGSNAFEKGTVIDRSNAALSVLGPQAVGRMIDALSEVAARLRDANGKYDKATSDRYLDVRYAIAHVPGASLVAAVQARSAQANDEQMAFLADMLSHHSEETGRRRLFSAEDITTIRALVEEWGNRLLASGNAERWQVARIATLASHVPDVKLLPLLKRLLDDNLRRYRAFREEAEAAGWRHGNAVNEVHQPMTHEYQRAFLAINTPETAALMREYLADLHFGELAATVLAAQWVAANEPPPDKRFFGGVDFSRVGEKRAVRAADPTATSAEAEAIFSVVNPLIAEDATDDQKKHATALGIVAARLPHGERDATIKELITLTPRRVRPKLLLNLILSGAEIESRLVTDGLAETLEAAKKEPRILTQSDGYELREWLRLLPFTNCPPDTLAVVRGIPDDQRQPHFLEELVGGLAETPSEGGEEVLFKLAEEDPHFYQNHKWRAAALKLGTKSSARNLIDLTANGAFDGKSLDNWGWLQSLGALIAEFPEVRKHVYGLLTEGAPSPPLALLAKAVSENPDTEGLLLLIDIENKQKKSFLGWRTIENVVTEQVSDENWSGAYNVVPVPAVELRQKLLAMTTDGSLADAAARCLNTIDVIRDEYGVPVSEPRHPDLASGKPWPIMTPDPCATAD